MNERQKLRDLYDKHDANVREVQSQCPEGLNGPFYIWPNDEFLNSKIRIAFVGQETRGWPSGDLESQLSHYERFNLAIDYRYKSSPIWSVIRKLEERISGSTYNSSWLNLNRFDENKKRPPKSTRLHLQQLDYLVGEELKILSPDVTVWFTSHHFDHRLQKISDAKLVDIDSMARKVLCEFDFESLPGVHFRTYHPRFLRQSGNEKKVINAICQNVSTNPG